MHRLICNHFQQIPCHRQFDLNDFGSRPLVRTSISMSLDYRDVHSFCPTSTDHSRTSPTASKRHPPPSDGRRIRSQVRAGGSSTNQTWDAWGVAATRAGDWMSGLIHSHRRTFPSLPFLQGCPATRLPRGIISRLQNMHAGRMAASCMFDRLPPHPVGRHRVTPFLPYRRK